MGEHPFKDIFLAFFVFLACAGSIYAAPVVAVVGAGEVLEQDISDWQAAQGCYGEDAITSRKAGFMRMFEAAILEEVLNRLGRPITREEYAKEVARIDAETRAPEILGCIKKYFGDGTARYEKIFVRPILAQRFIRELVKSDPKVQEKAYGLRDGVLKDIDKKKVFKKIGLERGIAYSTAAYSVEEDTSAPAALEPWKRWSPFEGAFIEENLKDLKPGEVKAKPIEDEANIKFVRLISVTGKKYYFESLTVPKLTTENYLKSVKKLPCKINDRELHDWAAPIKGNPILAPAEIAPW
jgi:hypothetical protein